MSLRGTKLPGLKKQANGYFAEDKEIIFSYSPEITKIAENHHSEVQHHLEHNLLRAWNAGFKAGQKSVEGKSNE